MLYPAVIAPAPSRKELPHRERIAAHRKGASVRAGAKLHEMSEANVISASRGKCRQTPEYFPKQSPIFTNRFRYAVGKDEKLKGDRGCRFQN